MAEHECTCTNCGGRDHCKIKFEPSRKCCCFWKPELKPIWIPVEDALPENLTPVIITYANRYPIMPCYQKDKGKPYVGAAYCHNDKWFWYSITCEDLLAEYGYSFADEMDDAIEVLAWTPMPDAYEQPEVMQDDNG